MSVLLFAPSALRAQTFQNLDQLDSLVAMTVGASLGQPGGPAAPIDRRLHLTPCASTPQVTGPTFGAAIVSCPSVGWRLRVPLVPSAQGADAGHTNAASEPARDIVIRKGDPVELVAGGDLFSISRQMIADEDGAVGQTITVREDRKSPPVSARVERAGLVRAPTT